MATSVHTTTHKKRRSTSSQEASPASPSAKRENEKAREILVTSGQQCLESYTKVSPHGSLPKTFLGSLVFSQAWCSKRSVPNWRTKVTPYRRLLFQLVPSAPHINGIGSGLLPTAVTSGLGGGTGGNRRYKRMQQALLPTPQASDYIQKKTSRSWKKKGAENFCLSNPDLMEKLLPTPTTQDARIGVANVKGNQHRRKRGSIALADKVQFVDTGQRTGFKLQPAFALWMMGYPEDYLDLEAGGMPPSKRRATASSRRSQKRSSGR